MFDDVLAFEIFVHGGLVPGPTYEIIMALRLLVDAIAIGLSFSVGRRMEEITGRDVPTLACYKTI